ncbi:PREDICTED: uncharacterized protein LOC106787955 [Polistes canadensis]|uniref:uncharacterized protein LOC106787955 n=1 Tax=Polistes canadensis TaxID=91411 RepID=UPI000718E3BC|nr:PREDICTED: uncharacterized protein LOC106787955 [Polistes canadensis]
MCLSFRDNLFSIKCICASIGLFYLTHRYFLSNIWYTMENTYNFFFSTLLLYTTLVSHLYSDPPKSDEVFNFAQCELLLEIFHTIYMENLALLRLTCLSHYNLRIRLNATTNSLAA